MDVPPLDTNKLWDFKPSDKLKVDNIITGGTVLGSVYENSLFDVHRILLPPFAKGKIKYITPPANYHITDKIIELEHEGKTTAYSMSHWWPVR